MQVCDILLKLMTLKYASIPKQEIASKHHKGTGDLDRTWPFHVEVSRGGHSSALGSH